MLVCVMGKKLTCRTPSVVFTDEASVCVWIGIIVHVQLQIQVVRLVTFTEAGVVTIILERLPSER